MKSKKLFLQKFLIVGLYLILNKFKMLLKYVYTVFCSYYILCLAGFGFGHAVMAIADEWTVIPIAQGGNIQRVSLDHDSLGVPYIAFDDQAVNQLKYAIRNQGGSWTIETIATGASINIGDASLEVGTDERPRVSYRGDWPNERCCLKYAERTAAASWSNITVNAGTDMGYHSSLVLDSVNIPHIVHFNFQGSPDHTTLYSELQGSNWTTMSVTAGTFPSLALDSNGYPRIAAHTWGTNDDLKYCYWDGFTWQVNIIGHKLALVALALDSIDRPCIAVSTTGGGILYLYFDGVQWQTDTVHSGSGVISYGRVLAFDSGGNPHIVYRDTDGGGANNQIVYARKTGATWTIQTVYAIASGVEIRFEQIRLLNNSPRIAFNDGTTVYYCSILIPPTIMGNVIYSDVNKNSLVDGGDTLTLQFDRRMQVNSATTSDFYIPVTGDSLGTGASLSINTANDTQVVITLGATPTLTILGTFDIGNTTSGSPSGIDISATMSPNAIEDLEGVDAQDGGVPGVNDSGMDILATVLPATTYVPAYSAATVQVSTDTVNAYYTEHKLILPKDSLVISTTIWVGPPGENHGELSAVSFSPPNLTFSSDTPATLVIEYKDADAKLEAGYMENAMRIHQWKSQDSTWVLVPQTYSMQSVDTTTKTVSVKIDKFNMVGATGNFGFRSNFAEASLDKISDFGFAGNTTVVYANIALPSVGATTTTVAPAPSGFSFQGCDGVLLRNVNPQFASGAELPQNRLLFSPTTSVTLSVTTTGIYTKHQLVLTDYTTSYSGTTVILTQATLEERHDWQNYAVLKIVTQGTITTRAILTMEYKDHDDANNQFKNDVNGGAEYQMRIYMWREEYGFWQKISGFQIVNRDENTVSVPIPSLSISQLYAVGVDTTALPVAVDYPWEKYD